MKRPLSILSACPSDRYFAWELRVQLYQFRKIGCSAFYHVLVFIPHDRLLEPLHKDWEALQRDYPEVQFRFYADYRNHMRGFKNIGYIQLLRPWMLRRYFEEYPHLSREAVLYIDSDVLLPHGWEFLTPLLDDEVNYLSNCSSYMDAHYFDSKAKDVIPGRLEWYHSIDVLKEATWYFGITREICEQHNGKTGGAQYLLKNITASFWNEVYNGICDVFLYLRGVNQRFFPTEEKGFQAWCADMWATQWLLWKKGVETKTPESMDFSWATDEREKWEKNIYHNAGAPKEDIFNKRLPAYVNNERTPYEDNLSFVSPRYCSYEYVKILDASRV